MAFFWWKGNRKACIALGVAIGIAGETDSARPANADGDQFFYARARGVWNSVLLGLDSSRTSLLLADQSFARGPVFCSRTSLLRRVVKCCVA
ncbi:unnamed protein product [Penicillium roqueforti FM164]|uniref:Genomic scaffold, ProqFM164S02 n=1 Tax=Penicillium roqueforti (strain FM164) TaxID=1365484 RepID=W6Q200_PENRF|nr:unnamed protein product [Penicillium roqueforti FM164]